MKIALVQQHATSDKAANLARGIAALERAAREGAQVVAFAELAFEPFHPQCRASGEVAQLAETVPGRSPLLDGFGLVAFTALFPILSVLTYAQLSDLRERAAQRRKQKAKIRAESNNQEEN